MTAKSMYIGITAAFAMAGINVDQLDIETKTVLLSIPRDSYEYELNKEQGGLVTSPEEYAKQVKRTWTEMGVIDEEWKVKFKTYDTYWTKELGTANYNRVYSNIITTADKLFH